MLNQNLVLQKEKGPRKRMLNTDTAAQRSPNVWRKTCFKWQGAHITGPEWIAERPYAGVGPKGPRSSEDRKVAFV